MEDLTQVSDNVSGRFGMAGFIVSLFGLVLGFFFPVLLFLSIVGIILSAIQLKKHKTGLGVAGLVMGIIGVVFLLVWFVLMIFIHNSVVSMVDDKLGIESSVSTDSVSDDNLIGDGPIACLDALTSVYVESVCINGKNIKVNLDFRMWHDLEEIEFATGEQFIRKSAPKEATVKEFILEMDSNVGEILQISLLLDGKKCGVLKSIVLENC